MELLKTAWQVIPFNKPLVTQKEKVYLSEVFKKNNFCGDGEFTKKCNNWLEVNTKTKKALLTTSCTHALEMAAILIDIKPGEEVIMPSYTFVSTANAFVLRGAIIVFVDIRADTLNIDETKIEQAITSKTRAIVPVHYAGVGCEMDTLIRISNKYKLYIIEDAALGMMADYKGKKLGTIGHIGCYSFHETKNYQCGEGGAILINDETFIEKAEMIREKGTNHSQFLRGQVDKYTWMDIGSSYLPSELNAAFLLAQLESAEIVNQKRLSLWQRYFDNLRPLEDSGKIELPKIPKDCHYNAHIFYIKLKNIDQRQEMINYLKHKNIESVSHYIPLHTSRAGRRFGKFHGEDVYSTKESERLLRLPMYYDLSIEEADFISDSIKKFFA